MMLQCNPKSMHNSKQEFFRMSMAFDVTIATDINDSELHSLWSSIDSLLAFWEVHYSQSDPHSEVHALNHRTSDTVLIKKILGTMIADALGYSDTTRGMFDPTILPIKELWGLGENDSIHRIPAKDTLARVLGHVDYRKVHINQNRDTVIFTDAQTTIDAGGFAKGYALIELANFLDDRNFHNYLIAAGDIIAKGKRFDGFHWTIGIKHPRADKLLATVPFDTGAIFTSGDYENFWMDGTRRIHHIFNPHTGCSCTNNQSVTIRSNSPKEAKYLSTGLFCMHADSILSFVEKRGLDCVVVDSTGTIFISNGWKKRVSLQ
jgi:FAD:protein FMN transferase